MTSHYMRHQNSFCMRYCTGKIVPKLPFLDNKRFWHSGSKKWVYVFNGFPAISAFFMLRCVALVLVFRNTFETVHKIGTVILLQRNHSAIKVFCSITNMCPSIASNILFPVAISCYRSPRKLSEGTVLIGVCLSVRLSVNLTSTHDELDLILHASPYTPPPPPDIRHHDQNPSPGLRTSGSHHWRPIPTCLLQDYPTPASSGADIYWYSIYGQFNRVIRILLEYSLVPFHYVNCEQFGTYFTIQTGSIRSCFSKIFR